MKHIVLISSLAVLSLISCGGDNSNTDRHAGHVTSSNANSKTLVSDELDGKQVVVLMAGDDMKFNAKEIRIKAGMPVELTLKHTGKMPKTSMGHNVVILSKDAVVSDFVNRANAAEATDYIPNEYKDVIIAHTKMLGGGEQDMTTFTINEPGTYPFMCTFLGHSVIMKGKVIVE
jgi:azurin